MERRVIWMSFVQKKVVREAEALEEEEDWKTLLKVKEEGNPSDSN